MEKLIDNFWKIYYIKNRWKIFTINERYIDFTGAYLSISKVRGTAASAMYGGVDVLGRRLRSLISF